MLMKTLIAIALILVSARITHGQDVLSLTECYRLAESNYPRITQRHLIDLAREYSLENAGKGALPRISFGGQATYQSDVTQIPVEMPGVEPLSKDQYRVFAEVSQPLYQGGTVGALKEQERNSSEVEHLQLDVELYSIRARVNELYFGVLLMEEQHRITALRKKDLSSALAKINAMVLNGTAIRSSAASLEAELLKVDQRLVEIESGADAYRTMLGRFINEQIGPDTRLERAVFEPAPDVIERQELRVFDAQRRLIEANKSMLAARRKPRLELFIQGGYGRPGLNMLKNEFDLYYLGGLRFTWLLSAYYTAKKEEQLLSLRQQSIDVQRETFLFNTAIQLSEYESEINKLLKLTEVDHRIIRLRTEVRETARAQLDEGVITSSDFIREVNAEDQAKQDLALHQTQLLLAQARYHFASGH